MQLTLEFFVWTIFAAITVALLYGFVTEKSAKTLASRLLDAGADSADHAKTLQALGYKNSFVKGIASHSAGTKPNTGTNAFSRAIVKCGITNAPKTDHELLFAPRECSYYIPEEHRTKSFYKHLNDHFSVRMLIGCLALLVVFAMAADGVIRFLGDWAADLGKPNRQGAVGIERPDDSLLHDQQEQNDAQEKADRLEAEISADQAKTETESDLLQP